MARAKKKIEEMEKPVVVIPEIKYDDIVFFKRRRGGNKSNDVYVGLVAGKNKQSDRIHLRFGDNVKNIYPESEYVICGVYQNRMYLQASDVSNGYKLSRKAYTTDVFFSFEEDDKADLLRKFVNEYYQLKHDDVLNMYYIEREEKAY